MKRKSQLRDRKPLIEALERETGEKAVYSGMPSFQYRVGPYTIFRDGSLEVPDDAADPVLLEKLEEKGLLERTGFQGEGIVFDTAAFTGQTMTNIVNCFASKGTLINKALGTPNAFHMYAALVRELNSVKPATIPEFMTILYQCGGESAIKGIQFGGGKIVFTGFPNTRTCRQLAECIVRACVRSQWMKGRATSVSNEKYTFRVWINALGMKGTVYADARAELLRNLEGDPTYRTEEQKEAFLAKKRKQMPEPSFVVL